LNDVSDVSQDQENKSSLLLLDQSVTNKQHDGMEQLNPDVEVLQFSENTVIDNISIGDVKSAPIPTRKYNEVLALIFLEA
jgi:hypothetical protein